MPAEVVAVASMAEVETAAAETPQVVMVKPSVVLVAAVAAMKALDLDVVFRSPSHLVAAPMRVLVACHNLGSPSHKDRS